MPHSLKSVSISTNIRVLTRRVGTLCDMRDLKAKAVLREKLNQNNAFLADEL